MKPETTLITGCTSGIGLHLAHEFAAHGHPLVLVAPIEEELADLAAALSDEHGISTYTIAKDLERDEAPLEIFYKLEAEGIQVDILANNAGQGFRGKFWDIPLESDVSMIRLNVEAVVRMTKFFLPPMIQRGSGRILNTASIAGFEPGPSLAIYHATKAFVLSLSEALAVELEDTGVGVTALCPGPTDTDFFPKADMTGARVFQKGQVMAPQDVARAAYKALMKNDRLIVPGGMNKALVAARRVLTHEAQAKLNEKFYEEVPVEEQTRQRGDIEEKARVSH